VLAETPDFIFNEALKNYPDIQVAQLRKMSAEQSVKAAEAAKYPTLSGFYQIRTNYSSLGVRIAGTELVTRNFGNVTLPNVGSVPLLVESTSPIYGKDPIFSQLETNISSGVGLTLSVPILNNLQIKTAIQRSQLNIIQIDNNIKVLAQQLKNTIYQTHTQAQVLKERFVAVQKTIGAQKENIEIIRKKQTLGSANMFELLNAEQNLPILQSEYLQLKYNLLYQIKILDFYAGKGLQF
jgi:outer membrane protein